MSVLRLFANKQRGADFDALIETECSNCFMRITGFKEKNPMESVVYLSDFTSHSNSDQLSWKWRRTRIWNIIRGRLDPSYEIMTTQVLDSLIKALQECRQTVWDEE